MNPEKCENSKKMFIFQTGVEIPTPRASLVGLGSRAKARNVSRDEPQLAAD